MNKSKTKSKNKLQQLSPSELNDLTSLAQSWYCKKDWSLTDNSRFDVIWMHAERHNLGGLIGSLLMAKTVKEGSIDHRKRFMSNALHHQQALLVCNKLQNEAVRLNIPLAFFKGPALSENAYSDTGIRTYSDIDVLVDSRADAWALVKNCNLVTDEGSEELGAVRRFSEPGRLHAYCGDWQVEFCYPITSSCDPMFDLFLRFRERIFVVPKSSEILASPDPEMHFLLLLQHMARHFCSRIDWFLDIVVFYQKFQDEIDLDFITKELEQMQCLNIASEIFNFCRTNIDPSMPVLRSAPGWNNAIQIAITSKEHYRTTLLSHTHEKGDGWGVKYMFFLKYLLITDPQHHSIFRNTAPSRWVTARIGHALRVDLPIIRFTFDRLYILLGGYAGRLFARRLTRNFNKEVGHHDVQ